MIIASLLLAVAPACSAPPPPVVAGEAIRIPIEIASNHVYVKVCAGDREQSFIFDTGAAQTYFDIGLARAAGMRTSNSFRARGAGAGTIEAAQIAGGEIRIAGTNVTTPVLVALDLSAMVPREGHAMDGIIGADFIARYVIAIDYAASEMRLYDRATYRYTGTATRQALTFIAGHPYVDGEIRLADGGSIKGRFVVDVGSASALTLTKTVADANQLKTRIGKTVRRPAGGGVGGMVTADVGRVASLVLGGTELKAPITMLFGDSSGVFSDPTTAWIGNIGGDILRRFTVILDYGMKSIILEPNPARNEPFETDMSGATLAGAGSLTKIVVDYVLPGSPAAVAGLAVGDSVIAINGVPVTETTLIEWKTASKKERVSFALTVRRGALTKTVIFLTKRIV